MKKDFIDELRRELEQAGVSKDKTESIIDDYENAEIVQAEFYEKGLDENYVIKTNEDVANSGLTSVQNVKSFAKIPEDLKGTLPSIEEIEETLE